SSATSHNPRCRAKARSAAISSAEMIHPVGFEGELTKIPRVRESQAANSRSRSRRQPPPGCRSSETSRGSPPITVTAAAMFGHTGTTKTRLMGGEPRLRSEEHTSELQSLRHLVCRLLLEKKK